MQLNLNNAFLDNLGMKQGMQGASQAAGLDAALASSANSQTIQSNNHLTITNAVVSQEDIAAAQIPDAALSRDDALGKLIGSAFNLPPPPMPDFNAKFLPV